MGKEYIGRNVSTSIVYHDYEKAQRHLNNDVGKVEVEGSIDDVFIIYLEVLLIIILVIFLL